jgi:predicted TIM-barrel enzyme
MSRAAKVTERAAAAIQGLDQPILVSTNGGAIAANQDANKRLRHQAALYHVRLVVAQDDVPTTMFMQPVPGIVQIG